MLKSLKQLFQEAKSFNLSGDEKSLIWRELQMHVRNDLMARQHIYRSKLKIIKLTLIKPMPIFIVILLALGGTSFAAEKALPGDVFYPVKLNVNEHVQGWLSLSDEAKANWETVLANRRLSEAEELAAHSKLDAKTEAQIESNFEQHANKAQEHIAKLANKDAKAAADIAADLQTSLEVHNRILTDINTSKDGNNKSQLEVLILKVGAETKDISDDRVKNEDEIKTGTDIQAAAEGRLNAVENKLAEVQKFVENKKADIGTDAMVQIQAQLKVVADLIAQGKVQLNVKAYGQAFTLFGQAKAKAQAVKLFIEAKTHFEDEDNADNNDSDLSEDSSPQPSVSSSPSVFRGKGTLRDREQDHRGSSKINIDIGL